MKKLVALFLAAVMMVSCVACGGNAGGNNDGNDAGNETAVAAEANEILTKVLEKYNETSADPLGVVGGNTAAAVMDAPAKFDLTAEGAAEELTSRFCVPAETIANIDDAASMAHAMMANNFSAAAYHVADKANVDATVTAIKDATMNNQWMCGFPETLVIYTIGEDYVVTMYGSGDIITGVKTAVETVYGDAAKVVVEETLW